MTAKLPPAPRGSVLVLSMTGTTLHDAFVGAERTVCGATAARVAAARHRQRLRLCRRCAAYRRGAKER